MENNSRRKLTDQQLDQAVCLYKTGESATKLAKRFGISQATMCKWLKRCGVSISCNPSALLDSMPNSEKVALAEAYRKGMSSGQLAKKYGTTAPNMCHYLSRLGVTLRPSKEANRRYKVNELAFRQDSPARNYFFGLLLADGCIVQTKSSAVLALTLKKKDDAIIDELRKFLGSDHPIHTSPGRGYVGSGPTSKIAISSMELTSSLESLGLTSRKSGKEVMPICLLANPDAWRGYVDGDGWVCVNRNNRPGIGITGSHAICEQFAEMAYSIGLRRSPIVPNHSIWRVHYQGAECVPLIRHLYNRDGPSVRRKQIVAHAILASSWACSARPGGTQ